MNKKAVIFVASAIGVFVLSVLVWMIIPNARGKYIAKNCPDYNYNPGFVGPRKEFIDCKNNIGIEKYSDEEFLTVFNGLFYSLENWDSFHVHAYKINGAKIYYIEDSTINTGQWTYFAATQYPDLTKSLSLFRVIDTITSNITLYKNLDDAPADERLIFQELKNSSK